MKMLKSEIDQLDMRVGTMEDDRESMLEMVNHIQSVIPDDRVQDIIKEFIECFNQQIQIKSEKVLLETTLFSKEKAL